MIIKEEYITCLYDRTNVCELNQLPNFQSHHFFKYEKKSWLKTVEEFRTLYFSVKLFDEDKRPE